MIELGDNTSRWGAPPAAIRAMRDAADAMLCGYPEMYSRTLKDVLARYAGVDPDMIVTGNGSDDILDSTFRGVAEPGDRLAMLEPTFVMVPIFAQLHRLMVDRVPLDASYRLPVDPLLANAPRIIYLCAPNNPTGTVIPRATIEEVVSRAPGVVLVDEAYFEFAGETAASLVREFPQLIVARTLSKAFGLAGLRVGYAIASPKMVRAIEAARGPYTVSAMSERAAAAAVELDGAWVRENVANSVAARDRLAIALRQRGLDVPPSATNFVFAPVANAGAIAKAMRERGVSVRPFAKIPQFCAALVESKGEALRITAGPDDEIDAALTAFDEARAACV